MTSRRLPWNFPAPLVSVPGEIPTTRLRAHRDAGRGQSCPSPVTQKDLDMLRIAYDGAVTNLGAIKHWTLVHAATAKIDLV